MLSYRKIVPLLCLITFALSSCMEHKVLFRFYNETNNEINKNVFKEIPGLGSSTYGKFPVVKKADKIEMYISTFREKYVEKDHLAEFSELNDSSKIASFPYLKVIGYSQDLYILKYGFTYLETQENGNISERPMEAAIFFSVKYNGTGDTIGVTPCYFGIINRRKNTIAFDTKLSLKEDGKNYYLKLHKKKKGEEGLLFIPANFPENPSNAQSILNIQKIVKLDPGKVGGYKPLVFNIAEIFHDPSALQFHYKTTLIIKN